MKLHTDSHGFEGSLPEKRIAMTIKSSAKMFEILSSGIYKDKILAVIREYVCNAFDAHVSVGKRNVPFNVKLPNRVDPTFSVTDFGTGVDPDHIGEIFWTYGESTKTNSNDTIGALGLGSKSAFAYTKSSFIVKNRWNGTEYVYFCFINENGEPEGSQVGETPTKTENGITVEFAVRPEDTFAFIERFKRLFKYWENVKPTIEGIFYGQCSELCGKDHSRMPIAVRVVKEETFAAWSDAMKAAEAAGKDAAAEQDKEKRKEKLKLKRELQEKAKGIVHQAALEQSGVHKVAAADGNKAQ